MLKGETPINCFSEFVQYGLERLHLPNISPFSQLIKIKNAAESYS